MFKEKIYLVVALSILLLVCLNAQSSDKHALNSPLNPPRSEHVNYGRPFEPPTQPAFIPLPPGAVEPGGWLRDWCLAARDGFTGHMDEVDIAFQQAWVADYKMTGERL